VGLGAALRLSALSHGSDPAVRVASSSVQRRALEVALRLQHLAAGWLIYAYNGDLDLLMILWMVAKSNKPPIWDGFSTL
jgi:hypothetical protein